MKLAVRSAVRQKVSLHLICPCAWVFLSLVWLGGCDGFKTDRSRFLSPDKVIRAPSRSSVYPILPSLSAADPQTQVLPNATFPAEGDWTYTDEDYVIGPTDILDISVLDLFSEGLETVVRREVSASGFIDLPELTQRIKAEGRTKDNLTRDIRQAYMDEQILRSPTVSVTIAARRQNTFSILGAVGRPGTYNISKKDMRLLDALALAGDVSQTNIVYIYVNRPVPAILKSTNGSGVKKPAAKSPAKPPKVKPPGLKAPDLKLPELPSLDETGGELPSLKPGGQTAPRGERAGSKAASKPATGPNPAQKASPKADKALEELHRAIHGAPRDGASAKTKPASRPTGKTPAEPGGSWRSHKWVRTNGRWVRVALDAPPASQPSGRGAQPVRPAGFTGLGTAETKSADPFGWRRQNRSRLGRLIAINLDKLRSGDGRMNIIVRDNDFIFVPPLQVGEFYVMGEVSRPGAYSLTGRRVTIKQALAAAGNIGPLGWPENSILVRRVGPNQEQVVPVNVEAICRGDKPDIFLKPDDVLAIGTDVRASFAAVLRNAFRMTYGFGFIYDRNFADPIIDSVDSQRFKRL